MKIFKSRSLIREFPGLTIYVEKIENEKLDEVSISYREGSDSVCRILAKRGKIMTDKDGYIYLFLENGFIETYSIKKNKFLLKISFDAYTFSLPYQRRMDYPPYRRIKEMTLPLLLDNIPASSQSERRDALLVINKKLFFTFLPLFYLFFGFYTGIGIRASGYLQILGAGLSVGLVSYFLILFGEVITYKSGNIYTFLIVPFIFILATFLIRKKFSHVT